MCADVFLHYALERPVGLIYALRKCSCWSHLRVSLLYGGIASTLLLFSGCFLCHWKIWLLSRIQWLILDRGNWKKGFHTWRNLLEKLGHVALNWFILTRRAICEEICFVVNRKSAMFFEYLKKQYLCFSWFCPRDFVFRSWQLRGPLRRREGYQSAQRAIGWRGRLFVSSSMFLAYLDFYKCSSRFVAHCSRICAVLLSFW